MPPRKKTNKPENRTNTKRRNANGRRGILLGVGLALALAAAWFGWRTFHKASAIRNVLLISIDTCRADRLSCYGYPSKSTPNIDAVAAEATLFRNAYTPVPMTLPAHCSMLAGTIPPYHGVHDNVQYGFSGTTLADLLKARGFYTGGIVSAVIMDKRYGLNQGFDSYLDAMPPSPRRKMLRERKGGDTTRLALDFLDQHGAKPFFLFLHYYDAHSPYDPPEPFASQYQDKPYVGEIAYVDSCIGQVVAKLKEQGLYDSTLLVITSDHGEMLGEHGEPYHSFFIYQGVSRVVLVMRVPGQKRGGVVEQTVGLVDIVPTVCGLLKVRPPRNIQGVDLTPLLKGGKMARADRGYYLESLSPTKYKGNSLLGLVQGGWKYIQTTRPELYDLEKDPGEEKNLASSRPELAAALQGRLKSLLEKEVRSHSGGKNGEWDSKAVADLAALGYVQGSVVEDFTFSQDKEDPKDLIEYHAGCVSVRGWTAEGSYRKATEKCQEMIREKPGLSEAYGLLGTIRLQQRDYGGAVEYLQKAFELAPEKHLYHSDLGVALVELGRADEALKHFEEAVRLEPRSSELFTDFGIGLNRLRRFSEAEGKFRKALELDPLDEQAHGGLGAALLAQGKRDGAIEEFTKALEINPANAGVHNFLGRIFLEKGERQKALAHWSDSLRLDPKQPEVLDAAAKILVGQGQAEQALERWESQLQLQPKNPQTMSRLALLKSNPQYPKLKNPAEALTLAQQSCEITGYKDLECLYALATALAASEKLQEASEIGTKALRLAEEKRDTALAASIRDLLEFCKRGAAGGQGNEKAEKKD